MRKHIRQKTKDPKPRLVVAEGVSKHKTFDDSDVETEKVCSRSWLSISLYQQVTENVSSDCKEYSARWVADGMFSGSQYLSILF